MAKKQSTTTPAEPETPKDNSITYPIDVVDAFLYAFDIVKGLDSILAAAACSDDGLSPEACKTLDIGVEALLDQMKIIDSYI